MDKLLVARPLSIRKAVLMVEITGIFMRKPSLAFAAGFMLTGCMVAGTAHAQTVYTDRAAFDAAVGGSTTRNFPSATGSTDAPITLNSVTFSATGSSGNRAVVQDGLFSNSVYLAQIGGTSTVSSSLNGVGLYIGSADGRQSFGYTFAGMSGTFVAPSRGSSFIGFFNTAPVNVTFNLSNFREFDITSFATQNVAAAPEPATWGLMILGFLAVGGVLRRKRSATSGRLAAV